MGIWATALGQLWVLGHSTVIIMGVGLQPWDKYEIP